MRPKNISYQSSKLLNHLLVTNKEFFTTSDVTKIFPENKPSSIRELLSDMVERGLILRIKNGLYCIIPYERESSTYFPEWHLVAEALAQNKDYYIGFYSALDIHNLLTQPSLKEQIITHERIRPKTQRVKNRHFEIITIKKDLFFGYRKTWIDDFNKINCSDLEKTFVDCFYMPEYAAGIIEIVKALYRSRNNINENRLIEYAQKLEIQTVIKRMGYIFESLNLFPSFIKEMKKEISASYIILDPSRPKEGKSHSNWRVKDNIGSKNIIESINT